MSESKFLGSILGSALGDGIGEIAFFIREDDKTFQQHINDVPLYVYTDDTAMALGLGESIITMKGRIDCEQLGKTFHANFLREPRRGYGPGPPRIFSVVNTTGESYVDVARRWYGGTGSFGNGAAMRIAPLGVFFHDSSELYEETRRSAVVTHAHPLGIDGAAALAKAIALAVTEVPREQSDVDDWMPFLDTIGAFVRTEEFRQQINLVKTLFLRDASLETAASKLGTDVTALESVPFSIFAFLKTPHSFEKCLLETVMIEGDRDTIGAMVGALLGAYLGYEAIPEKWLGKLENRQRIEVLAKQLWELKKLSG